MLGPGSHPSPEPLPFYVYRITQVTLFCCQTFCVRLSRTWSEIACRGELTHTGPKASTLADEVFIKLKTHRIHNIGNVGNHWGVKCDSS